jgi:hypothetical protein
LVVAGHWIGHFGCSICSTDASGLALRCAALAWGSYVLEHGIPRTTTWSRSSGDGATLTFVAEDPHRDALSAAQQRIRALEQENDQLRNAGRSPSTSSLGRFGRAALFLLVVGGAIWCTVALFHACWTMAVGSFTTRGSTIGSWVMRVEDCTSGQPEGFYGVDLHSGDDVHGVRIVRDAVDGWVVNINAPASGNHVLQFRQDTCKVLEVSAAILN